MTPMSCPALRFDDSPYNGVAYYVRRAAGLMVVRRSMSF